MENNTENNKNETQITVDTIRIDKLFLEPYRVPEILEKIRKQALSLPIDITTSAGRKEIVSRSAKVTSLKTTALSCGKVVLSEMHAKYKNETDSIRNAVKMIDEKFTELSREIRKPVTDWEAEQKRKTERQTHLFGLREKPNQLVDGNPPTLDHLKAIREEIAAEKAEDENEQEHINVALSHADFAIEREEKRLAEQAELQRLRDEKEARDAVARAIEKVRNYGWQNQAGEMVNPHVLADRIETLEGMLPSPEREIEVAVTGQILLLKSKLEDAKKLEEKRNREAQQKRFNDDARELKEQIKNTRTDDYYAVDNLVLFAGNLAFSAISEEQIAIAAELKNQAETIHKEAHAIREKHMQEEARRRAQADLEAKQKAEQDRIEQLKQKEEFVAKIKNKIWTELVANGVDKAQAKLVVELVYDQKITSLVINIKA